MSEAQPIGLDKTFVADDGGESESDKIARETLDLFTRAEEATSPEEVNRIRDRIAVISAGLVGDQVSKITGKDQLSHLSREDLTAAGNIGLARAINDFDPKRGVRFSTYALPSIRREILRQMLGAERTISVPESAQSALNLFERVRGEIAQSSIGQLSSEELGGRSLGERNNIPSNCASTFV